MFSVKDGDAIAMIEGGAHDKEILSISDNKEKSLGKDIRLKSGQFIPIMSLNKRAVEYIAGPSESGKSTFAAGLIKRHRNVFPNTKVILFNQAPVGDDPAYAGIPLQQITMNKELCADPPDIAKDIERGSIIVFDDVGTIYDDTIRKCITNLMMSVMELGRKYNIYCIITSHLILPNEKKFARVIMNELQYLTVFPDSGSSQQITTALTNYFGMSKKQCKDVLKLKSRWARVHSRRPRYVMSTNIAYML